MSLIQSLKILCPSCWGMMENWVITPGPGHLVRLGTREMVITRAGGKTRGATQDLHTSNIVWRKISNINFLYVIIITIELSAFDFLFIYSSPTHYPSSIDSCTLDRGRFGR